MLDHFPRILLGILRNLFTKTKSLTDPQSQTFRVWPLLDTDDFATLAMPKYAAFCGVVAWTHGYTGGWVRASIQHKWYVYSRKCSFEFFKPARVFKKVTVVTRLLAVDEMSGLRLFDFYQGDTLLARAHFQLVVVSMKGGKVPAQEWMALTGCKTESLSEWPETLQSWKYS